MADGLLLAEEPRLFDRLATCPPDSLLALIGLARADTRPEKIDVGVGVYRDAAGTTPILRCVKAAERILLEEQETKAYLGAEGDKRFVELVKPIVFGGQTARSDTIVGVQTPGGCGALRLGAELVKAAGGARILVGQPTWPNHTPLIGAAGVEFSGISILRQAVAPGLFRRHAGCAARGEGRRSRAGPWLLPQSDRRRSHPQPVARACRPGRRTRPRAVRRPCLSRAWQRS